MKEVVLMSSKEMDRIQVLKQLHTGQLSQRKAADLLRLSTRQIRYLLRSYRVAGDKGVNHFLVYKGYLTSF
jgi:transcriptional regulator with GAF, ATPase, and Fis domain